VSPRVEILSEVVLNKPSWGITLSTKNCRSVIQQNNILLAFQGSDQLLESFYCGLVGATYNTIDHDQPVLINTADQLRTIILHLFLRVPHKPIQKENRKY